MNRWFKVCVLTEFDVSAPGPKTAIAIVRDNFREANLDFTDLEFKARDMTKRAHKSKARASA